MPDRQSHPLRHLARSFVGAATGPAMGKPMGSLRGAGVPGAHPPLAEAGVLFELAAADGSSRAALAASLGLGEGPLNTVLDRFAARGWLAPEPRNGPVRLSATGRAVGQQLQDGAHGRVADLLSRFSDSLRGRFGEEARLLAERLAGQTPPPPTIRRHRPGDLGWIAERHAALYAREYGLNGKFEAVVARICADFLADHDPACEAAFIAERAGEQGSERIGSTVVVREDRDTARLRLVLVEPSARGTGLGKRLVATAETFARSAGYGRMVLWTLSPLTAARTIYAGMGWHIVSSTPDSSYGPAVESEAWAKVL